MSPKGRDASFLKHAYGCGDLGSRATVQPHDARHCHAGAVESTAMASGEFVTKLSIWLAICAYAAGTALMLESRDHPRWRASARWTWTVGCVFFLTHVLCAFACFHQWSHAAAYRETARQTVALTGWSWGGGLYFNYLFALAWMADVLWWWLAPASFALRPRWLTGSWHGFLFFMVLNGAVIFVRGPMRWFGLLLCVLVVVLWCRYWRGHQSANRARQIVNHQS